MSPPFAPLDAGTEASAREQLGEADAAVLAGRAPPSVRALVRDHDAVVRVTDAGGRVDSVDNASTVATASSATVVETVARVEGSRLPADD